MFDLDAIRCSLLKRATGSRGTGPEQRGQSFPCFNAATARWVWLRLAILRASQDLQIDPPQQTFHALSQDVAKGVQHRGHAFGFCSSVEVAIKTGAPSTKNVLMLSLFSLLPVFLLASRPPLPSLDDGASSTCLRSARPQLRVSDKALSKSFSRNVRNCLEAAIYAPEGRPIDSAARCRLPAR